MAFLINGTPVAEPAHQGITITDEPVWSSNTGRTQTGKMTGDIQGWATTVAVTWPPLTFSESYAIRNAIRTAGAFFNITYNDFSAGQTITKKVYCANIPRTIYSLAQSFQRHQGVTITFISQEVE